MAFVRTPRLALRYLAIAVGLLVGLLYFYVNIPAGDGTRLRAGWRTLLHAPFSALQATKSISGLGNSEDGTVPSTLPPGPDLDASTDPSTLPCAGLEGANDVVVVIKTGSTEALEKLPVHFETTLKCFPHHIIYSDYAETIEGHAIYDALDNVSESVRNDHPDFEHWRKLQDKGREALQPSDLSTHLAADDLDAAFQNGGWKIDRFKNVPMIGKALAYKPDARWYVFADADTYIVWSSLLQWVKELDHTKSLYLGSPAVIEDQVFGHGGSGYMLSHPAMTAVAEQYASNQTAWDEFAGRHWAGDCILATLLQHIGIVLTWAFPIFQGGDPTMMDLVNEVGYDRRVWCYPVVAYHHVSQATISSLWQFEQQWISNPSYSPIRHAHVFSHYILPKLSSEPQAMWDNFSEDPVADPWVNGVEACQSLCEGKSTCVQFSFHEGLCKMGASSKLGAKSEAGVQSGWMIERIRVDAAAKDKCYEGPWIVG